MGIIRDKTGSFTIALATLAGFALLATVIALLLQDGEKLRRALAATNGSDADAAKSVA